MKGNTFGFVDVGINLSPSSQKIFNEVYPDPFTGKYGLSGMLNDETLLIKIIQSCIENVKLISDSLFLSNR